VEVLEQQILDDLRRMSRQWQRREYRPLVLILDGTLQVGLGCEEVGSVDAPTQVTQILVVVALVLVHGSAQEEAHGSAQEEAHGSVGKELRRSV